MAPILVTQLAQAGYGFIDTVMAGQVSPLDLAAVAIGSSVWLPLFLLISGIVMATTPLVAAAYGAKRLSGNSQNHASIFMVGFDHWL
jgi:MATE family multidrug resistance protein